MASPDTRNPAPSLPPSTFPYFRALPPEIRRNIYTYLISHSNLKLWLKESTHHTPTSYAVDLRYIPSCVQFSRWRRRYLVQCAALTHWGLAPARLYDYWTERDSDKARADPENTHATLLNLRLTNRDIGKEAEEVFFSKVRLWVEFDENFVEFLRRVTEERGVTDTTRGKRETSSPRGANDIALQIWLQKWRRLTFFLHEGRLRELGILRGLFEETPANKAGKGSRMQVCLRELDFVVCPFVELFSSPGTVEELAKTGDGDGELPVTLMTESNWDVNERTGNFRLLQKRGDPELWVLERPPIEGVQVLDMIFYKIAWEAEFIVPMSSGGIGHRFPAHGVYVSWTKQGVMKDLVGWEPDPVKEDPDWMSDFL